MSELESALDALAADDLHALSASEQLDRTALLVRARNRIDAELARGVRVADLTQAPEHDGMRTMRSWLRGCVAAWLSGRAAAAVEQGVDLAEVDAVPAGTAVTRQHADLGKLVHHYLACLDPDGVEPDPTEGRSLTIAKHSDGSVTLHAELDPVGGERVQVMLESFVQADRPVGDLRTRAQQLGDAATGPGAAEMGFGAVVSAARARWLSCDGTISRIMMGPDGEILDHGRSKRVVPRGPRRAVEIRDRHCFFAGCEAPPTGATSTMFRSGCSTRA